MKKYGSLVVCLVLLITTSIRVLFRVPRVPIYHGGYCIWGICVLMFAGNARICVDSIEHIVLRKGRIV